jgi:serine/threonine protein kinase
MALTAGTRLGAYEIVSALGTGGMGEVYRARDTKLHRDVAIKVLLESLAADAIASRDSNAKRRPSRPSIIPTSRISMVLKKATASARW